MISVIIPVYNNEDFIEKAITSALIQKEVSEVLVVNDGSTDRTSAILDTLATKHAHLKVLYHPGSSNRGRSASRNLGIQQAKNEYIAFLDSDDFYLENRFALDLQLLLEHAHIDGVYSALGVKFYRPYTEEEYALLKLTTIATELLPEELFYHMEPIGDQGYFSGDCLTVRKSIFDKTGVFNEALKVCEDTHLWIRMSLKASLYPGILGQAVTVRGIHDENVFNQPDLYITYRREAFYDLVLWAIRHQIDQSKLELLWKLYFNYSTQYTPFKKEVVDELSILMQAPRLLFSRFFIKNNIFTLYLRSLWKRFIK